MSAQVVVCNPSRPAKCRLCEKVINNDEKDCAVMINNVHVSPKIVDIWFHKSCWFKMFRDSIEQCVFPEDVAEVDDVFAIFDECIEKVKDDKNNG